MKILLLHQYFLRKGEGGGQRFNEFVNVWAKQGASVDVITGGGHYLTKNDKKKSFIEFETDEHNKIKIWRCYVSDIYHKGLVGRFVGYIVFFFSSLYVLFFKTEKKYDIIIATSPPLTIMFTGLIARFLKSGKLIFEIRDLWPDVAVDIGVLKSQLLIHFFKKIEKIFYKKADFINALSPDIKKYLIENQDINKGKVWMITNGGKANVKIVEPRNKELNVIYTGAMSLVNNVLELLILANKTKELKVKYILIGDGSQRNEILEYIKLHDLDNIDYFPLLSHQKTLEKISQADVGVVTYRTGIALNKNYTNKMFDYMSCAKPVVLTIPGASKELVEKNKCGWWLNQGDINEWVRVVSMLLNAHDLRRQFGENGYDLVQSYYNREALALEYFKLMKLSIPKNDLR